MQVNTHRFWELDVDTFREGAFYLFIRQLQGSDDLMRVKYLAKFPAHDSNSIDVYSLP